MIPPREDVTASKETGTLSAGTKDVVLGSEEPGPFVLEVDPEQKYKAKDFKICSFARPHMRAFHYSWWSFFIAFFDWFSIAPMLPEVKKSLGLTKREIWLSNIVGVGGDIVMRFVFGALTDKFGPRILMGVVLIFTSIPTACTGLVNNFVGLCLVRLFIGFGGASFVMCQCWTTGMFTKEIVGTANALVGGWGNVGGGAAQLVIGTALFPLFRDVIFSNAEDPAEKAWRVVCIVPAVVTLLTGALVIFTSEDCPEGNYKDLIKEGKMTPVSASVSFRQGAVEPNTWLLFIQYGCCFGIEITMNNAATTYFVDRFDLRTETAAAIASIFGFMNIFARGIGGYCSDKASEKIGMKGRLWVQLVLLLLEGLCILVFAIMESLWAAILMFAIFSVFVPAAEGSTYGIVPYVNPAAPGAVAGIVGAGGPSGAVSFGLGFMYLNSTVHAYFLMGGLVILSAVSCLLLNIKGHGGIFLKSKDVLHQQVSMLPKAEGKDGKSLNAEDDSKRRL